MGYHTPTETEKFINQLNNEFESANITFEDSSWGNDEADSSISDELGIVIYFPNANLGYGYFSIYNQETQNPIVKDKHCYNSLGEIFADIKKVFANKIKLNQFIGNLK